MPPKRVAPRNSLERRLGPDDLLVLERAHRDLAGAHGDRANVERVLARVYTAATSRAPYRPRTARQRVAYQEEALTAGLEALGGYRPGKRRTASLAAYVRNAMQTAIAAWQKREASSEFTTAAYDGLLNIREEARADVSPSILLVTEMPAVDDESGPLQHGDDRSIATPPVGSDDSDPLGRDSGPVTDLAAHSEVRAEINSTDADWTEQDRFGAAFVRSRPGKRRGFWSISTPDLPEETRFTTGELRARTERSREMTDANEFNLLMGRVRDWQPGDRPIRPSQWTQRQQVQFRLLAFDALRGVLANPQLRREIDRAEQWLSAGDVALVSRMLDEEADEQRRHAEARVRYRRAHRGGKWVPAIQYVYDSATPRERALYDATFVQRGEHAKRGLATLAREWGEDREKLRREAKQVIEQFKQRELDLERDASVPPSNGTPSRHVAEVEPEPIDLRTYRKDATRSKRDALQLLKGDPKTA